MKLIKTTLKLLLVLVTLHIGLNVIAQDAPPPPPSEHNGGGDMGGSAPIGEGLGILIALALAYGAKKTYSSFVNQRSIKE